MSTSWLLACVTSILPMEVHLEIQTEQDYMSQCHVAMTERSFEHDDEQCYCISIDSDTRRSQRD